MRETTGKGDGGWSDVMFGRLLRKTDPRFEAIGAVDELNSFLGLARAKTKSRQSKSLILRCQRELFVLGSELACLPRDLDRFPERIDGAMIARLDIETEKWKAGQGRVRQFAVPGKNETSALLDICRSVCRRAERCAARLSATRKTDDLPLVYLNRLSGLLFYLARAEE